MNKAENSKSLARKWPYPRQKEFENILRESAAAWFESKGFTSHHKMPYCLTSWDDWPNNIILPEVANYIKRATAVAKGEKPFPLHKFVHHGLSSQAMAFNLFGPLIVRYDYKPLEDSLRHAGIDFAESIGSVSFEYEDRDVFNEHSGQPTSLDIAVEDTKGVLTVLLESKLVEREFGGCSVFSSGDCTGANPLGDLKKCYLHFIGRTYWELMKKHGIAPQLEDQLVCPFTSYYQFFREILFTIEKNAIFVLLCDRRSAVFQHSDSRGLIPFMQRFLPSHLQERIVVLFVQDVLESIGKTGRHNDWVGEFRDKYGLQEMEEARAK